MLFKLSIFVTKYTLMIPLINKIYPLEGSQYSLDGFSKNSRILLLPDGKHFILTSGKIQAMILNNNDYKGRGLIVNKSEAAEQYPGTFSVSSGKLTGENVVAVLMPSEMFDYCKSKDPSPANYIRKLIRREMEAGQD